MCFKCPVLPTTVQGEFSTPMSPMVWQRVGEDVCYYLMSLQASVGGLHVD